MDQARRHTTISQKADGVCCPRCPNEVIKHILSHCRQDKHTLSVCMRVSPTFNALAAPLLYHTVELDFAAIQENESHNPFHVPSALIPTTEETSPRTSPDESVRLKITGSVTKQQCLAYIRHISVERHNKDQCHNALDALHHSSWAHRLAVDTVRYEFSAREEIPPDFDQHWLGEEPCRVEQLFNPRRFVFDDICPLYAVSPIPVDTTISIFRQAMDVNGLGPSPSDPPSARNFATRAVYVFLPRRGFYHHPNHLRTGGFPCYMAIALDDYEDLISRLEMNAWDSKDTKEVVVVNVESLKIAYEGADRADLAADLQSAVDRSHHRPKGTSDTPFIVKFITMKEFLQQYDWTGVLEEDEVGQWLD